MIVNCRWQNADVTGYATFPVAFENLTAGIAKVNLAGVTEGATAPSNGTWNVGDLVLNKAPAPGTNAGWVCVAAGTPGIWTRFGILSVDTAVAYDPPSLAPGAGATTIVAVDGAAPGDHAEASFSLDLQGLILTAYVSARNAVSVRFQNGTAGKLDLAAGTLRGRVTKL